MGVIDELVRELGKDPNVRYVKNQVKKREESLRVGFNTSLDIGQRLRVLQAAAEEAEKTEGTGAGRVVFTSHHYEYWRTGRKPYLIYDSSNGKRR